MSVAATTANGKSDEEQLLSKLATVTLEADQRTQAFMRGISPRQAALKLDELSTPEKLASSEGRNAIRAGYLLFGKILDDIESFERTEEMRVSEALSAATSGFSQGLAIKAVEAFKRGYARTSASHAALRAVQRESISVTVELVDVIDRAPGGVLLSSGRLGFADRETGMHVSRLLSQLSRLEMEEQSAEQAILESRRLRRQSDAPR